MLLYRLLLVSSFVLTILGAKIGRGEIDDESDTEADQEIEDEDNNFNLGDLKSPPVLGFSHGFLSSLSVILVSELGDKTFFIAAIMAMKYSRLTIFSGALLALAVMTVLSVFMGAITTVIPRYITYYVSTGLFGESYQSGCVVSLFMNIFVQHFLDSKCSRKVST